MLPNKKWTEKDDEDRANDYQERKLLRQMVDAKLTELGKEAAGMFPYSSEQVESQHIEGKLEKMDKQKALLLLKGENAAMDLESGLSAEEKFNIKNFIMRRFKFEQLKRMRMDDFKRKAKIILRQKKLALKQSDWTDRDRVNQIRQHKKDFIDYSIRLCTKKEDTVIRSAKQNIPNQKYFLSKQEKEKINEVKEEMSDEEEADKLKKYFIKNCPLRFDHVDLSQKYVYEEDPEILKACAASRVNSLRRKKEQVAKIDLLKIVAGIVKK